MTKRVLLFLTPLAAEFSIVEVAGAAVAIIMVAMMTEEGKGNNGDKQDV
jgi:hypothetical protein